MRKHGFLLTITAAVLAISMCGCENVNSNTPAANLGESTEQTSSDAPFLTVVPNSNSSVGNASLSGGFIEKLNSVIDSSEDIEALKRDIKNADTENRIGTIQVFEHPNAFIENVSSSIGKLNEGAIVYISFNDGKSYITSWCERNKGTVPVPMMFQSIITRADSVEQLAAEIDGYNLGLSDARKLTSISLYENYEDACNGDDSGEMIIENGKLIASDKVWENGGVVRVTYDSGKSWFCFNME